MSDPMHSPVQNFINGQYVAPSEDRWLENFDPAHGCVAGKVANSTSVDVDHAVDAAAAAFESWSQTSVDQRSAIMMRVADGIDRRMEELAMIECEDGGKPITRARTIEIPRSASNFRFYAAAITQFASELHESVGMQAVNLTLRQPLGVVGCISPWNLPLYLFTWKVAPAIATGNCVVAKPSEMTPRTAAMLGEICNEAGLPAGVLNIIHGEGATAGNPILEHPKVSAVSFTGGTETGKHVAQILGGQLKKFSLELGGKNPNLIFADADYERALQTSVMAAFANQGQICLCGSRMLVQREIYDRFKNDFLNRARLLTMGDPKSPETVLGSMISKPHFNKVMSYLDKARQGTQGESVLLGGNAAAVAGFDGYFIEPTVIEVTDAKCDLNQNEIFGPVVTMMPFDSEDEAVKLANDVRFGLSATLWTQDVDRMMRVSRSLKAGVIWVNSWLKRDLRTPFGGMKQSGIGREGGLESLRFFTEPKNVCVSYSSLP